MELTIEKLVYGGDGLARLPADSKGRAKAVFLPFVIEGERVEAVPLKKGREYERAQVRKVLEPSPHRVEPECPYFGRCGGCHYQQMDYEHQLATKAAILRETVRRTAKLELPAEIQVHRSPPWNYRNRTRLQVRRSPFAIGYYRWGSHELLPIESCPISSPLINQAIEAMCALGEAGGVPRDLFEIEFFADAEDRRLLVEASVLDRYWEHKEVPTIVDFAAALRGVLPAVTGVAVFRQAKGGALVREEVPEELRDVFGDEHLTYHTASANYQVSAGSFFQTNRHLIDRLVELVTAGRGGERALDLYAGTGLFTLPLSQSFREVHAVESAPFSFHDLKQSVPSFVKAHRQTTREFLEGVDSGAELDLVIVDPPRAGLGEDVTHALARLPFPRLTYVSCDPATLARDLRILMSAEFRVEHVHLVDLFPQTFHIESIFQLVR